MIDTLAKKRIAAGALIFNEDRNKILIVKPEYKNYWSFPGGVIERFESPSQGLKREIKEEIGLDMQVVRLLVIEYLIKPEQGGPSESIQFLFLCELTSGADFSDVRLAKGEIAEHRFVLPDKAIEMVSQRSAKRLKAGLESLKKNRIIYLESKY